MSELKPCPFCGSDDIDASFVMGFVEGNKERLGIGCGCMDCGASSAMIVIPEGEDGHKESIEAWNKRA